MWLVLGHDCLPIQPIDEFLTFHDITGSSPNTIRAYAHHLKLYWEYLTGVGVDWRSATLQDIVTRNLPPRVRELAEDPRAWASGPA